MPTLPGKQPTRLSDDSLADVERKQYVSTGGSTKSTEYTGPVGSKRGMDPRARATTQTARDTLDHTSSEIIGRLFSFASEVVNNPDRELSENDLTVLRAAEVVLKHIGSEISQRLQPKTTKKTTTRKSTRKSTGKKRVSKKASR